MARAPTRWLAPAGASRLLLASLATYYATYRIVDGNVDPLVVVFWVAAALTAAPWLAGLVVSARDPSWLGAAAAAFPAGLLLGEGLVAAARAAGPFAQPAFFVVAGFDLAAALLVLRWLAYPGGQRRALGLLPLFTLVGVGVTYLPRLYVVMILGGG